MQHFAPFAISDAELDRTSRAAVAEMRDTLGVQIRDGFFATGRPSFEFHDLTLGAGEPVDVKAMGNRIQLTEGILASGMSPFHADGTRFCVVRWGKEPEQCGKISFGPNTCISECTVLSWCEVRIGKGVLFGPGSVIMDCTGAPEDPEGPRAPDNVVMGPVVIEDHCWIGNGVMIMPGVTIGHHSTVATNSVVTKDVPPHSLVAGNPAVLSQRFVEE